MGFETKVYTLPVSGQFLRSSVSFLPSLSCGPFGVHCSLHSSDSQVDRYAGRWFSSVLLCCWGMKVGREWCWFVLCCCFVLCCWFSSLSAMLQFPERAPHQAI